VLRLLCFHRPGFGQCPDGVCCKAQPDPVGESLQVVSADRYNPATDSEESTDLNLNRLNLAVGSPDHIDDIAEALVVGSVDGQALYNRQGSEDVANRSDSGLARVRKLLAFLYETLSYSAGVPALGLDVIPACVGDSLNAIQRALQTARGAIQRDLATAAQPILVCLHAQ
jgi:hypothetical protein